MEYASKGVATAGLTTGIIGTTLGALDAMGGIGALLGGGRQVSEGDRPVTRYEMGLIKESIEKEEHVHKNHVKAILKDMCVVFTDEMNKADSEAEMAFKDLFQ